MNCCQQALRYFGGAWVGTTRAGAASLSGTNTDSRRSCDVAFHSRTARYVCKSAQATRWVPRRESRDDSERRCTVSDGSGLEKAMAPSTTVWFIGDSTALSHAQAAACALWRSGMKLRARATASADWHTPQWALPLGVRHARLAQSVCMHAPLNRRVCYIPCGALPHTLKSGVGRVMRRLLWFNLTQASDLIVANAGAWYMGHGAKLEASHLSDIRDLVTTLRNATDGYFGLDRRQRVPHFVWRESFAQHFDTPDGVYRPTATPRNCSTRLMSSSAAELVKPVLLQRVRGLLLANGIAVLDAWELTRTRADAHPPSRVGDCTHYCLTEGERGAVARGPANQGVVARGPIGGVYAALNDALALWVRSCSEPSSWVPIEAPRSSLLQRRLSARLV